MRKPHTKRPPTVLTIAGVDSGGGAGIAADLKTFAALGVHGACAVTAVTAQNTVAVEEIYPLPPEAVTAQIAAVMSDLGCQAAKTGMLATEAVIEAVYLAVIQHRLKNLVVDPVMVASSGGILLEPQAKEAYRKTLIPVARVVTPNVPEAEALLERRLRRVEDLGPAARDLAHQWDVHPEAVVITGGHLLEKGEAVDVVYERRSDRVHYLLGSALDTRATHGSGCVFSAALAAYLARGDTLLAAVSAAKEFTTQAIRGGLEIGRGHGPVNPLWSLLQEEGES